MPTEQIIHIALSVVMGMVSTIFVLWTRALRLEKSSLIERIETLKAETTRELRDIRDDMQALGLHVDKGTSKCSERTGEIQKGIGELVKAQAKLPQELSALFMPRNEIMLLSEESRRDRAALAAEVKALWACVRKETR